MAKSTVLFLCTGNSCRSQMAEGWARHLRGDEIETFSAGTRPKAIDPLAVEAMTEVGVDISDQRPKSVDEVESQRLDLVVTVCDSAAEECPVFPGDVPTLHRSFDDPPSLARFASGREEALAIYRRVRDEIRAFVQSLEMHAEGRA